MIELKNTLSVRIYTIIFCATVITNLFANDIEEREVGGTEKLSSVVSDYNFLNSIPDVISSTTSYVTNASISFLQYAFSTKIMKQETEESINQAIIRRLFSSFSKEDLNDIDENGNTLVILACKKLDANCRDCIFYHRNCAHYDRRGKCYESIYIVDAISSLVRLGANVNISNKDGETALDIICKINVDTYCPSKNDLGGCPGIGHPGCLDCSACIKARDTVEQKYDLLKLLTNAGANAEVQNKKGNTALHEFITTMPYDKCYMNSSMCQRVFQYFFTAKTNVNHRNMRGDTPLHLLTRGFRYIGYDAIEYAIILINAGANIYIQNDDRVTPYHLASEQKIARLFKKTYEDQYINFLFFTERCDFSKLNTPTGKKTSPVNSTLGSIDIRRIVTSYLKS